MGKWDRRYYPRSNRRSRYQDYDWSPPRETYRDPELGVWQDNVPMWEKKFCFLSGVPWEKVLSTNKFMHCHNNIAEWDDTAGKEAFNNAKEFYWSKVNGGQCDILPPSPDAYIAEIDWNPYIDPELIKDLDRTFFVPDDKEKESRDIIDDPSGRLDKIDDPWDRDHAQSTKCDDKENPWERQTSQESKDKATVWNQWDSSADAQNKPANGGNSWENHDRWDNATTKNNGQILNNNSAGWNQCNNRVNATENRFNYGNSWGYHDRSGNASNKYGSREGPSSRMYDTRNNSVDNGNKWRSGNKWQDAGESSWGHNQQKPGINRVSYPNGGSNYYGNTGYGGRSNHRENNWGQRQCGQYGGPRRGFVEERGQKREGPGQSSRHWNNGSSNKRVSFEPQ